MHKDSQWYCTKWIWSFLHSLLKKYLWRGITGHEHSYIV